MLFKFLGCFVSDLGFPSSCQGGGAGSVAAMEVKTGERQGLKSFHGFRAFGFRV